MIERLVYGFADMIIWLLKSALPGMFALGLGLGAGIAIVMMLQEHYFPKE